MPSQTGHPKQHDYKGNDHVAATSKDAAVDSVPFPDFFEEVAIACAAIDIRGVRASMFNHMRTKLHATSRRPTVDDARWVADEMCQALQSGRHIRNPNGLLIDIVSKVIDNGSTGIHLGSSPGSWGTHRDVGGSSDSKLINY